MLQPPAAPGKNAVPDSARSILLAVTGLTPQVVTETLYALMREGAAALPDEVHILTTAEGAQAVQQDLLADEPGWFHRFLADHDLSGIVFGPEQIHVLNDATGRPLSDIRSAQDNASAADQIADWVRRLTQDPQVHLHVSLAGGRKTLGFFAGYALSLWGRDGDRLTHVLVSEPYEASRDFFYPTPYPRLIAIRNGSQADCRDAEVTLADLPFVRLRHGLPQALLSGKAGFAQAVLAAQTRLGAPSLVIDLKAQTVKAAGQSIALAPAELAFIAWFARRAIQGLPGLICPSDGAPSIEYAAAYLAEYRRIRGFVNDDDRTVLRYRSGMTKADFEERKSKLKRVLEAEMGPAAQPYLIEGVGRRPKRYGLGLAAGAVGFGGER
jgi:CRISPR-associated protein (TIGR02584 family)